MNTLVINQIGVFFECLFNQVQNVKMLKIYMIINLNELKEY
jgi:hypothetical protein